MGSDSGESRQPLFPSRVETVIETLRAVSGVHDVKLAGSAAAGDRTPLSDWDFELDVNDEGVLDALEHALQQLTVLALFWDPLSARATLIVIMDGPIKVDVIVPAMRNPHPMSRWTVTAETLPRIDAHFWDWTLWLSAKQLRGQADLVGTELTKMWDALLEPMGAITPTHGVAEAVGAYVVARDEREYELGVPLDHHLEHQVRSALVEHGLMASN
jgi:predicted nucleotidyltransferase